MRWFLSLTLLLGCFVVASKAQATTYDGTWKSSGDSPFVAKIHGNHIRMMWKLDSTTSGLYWEGTFPTKVKIIVSKASSSLQDSFLGSQDKTKKFTHKGVTLTFKFRAMGLTKIITLKRKD